ncbi:MAG: hypothetical protein J7604_15815 [Sporocytophaga sp.]|uniref:hypothetical protein n=1 Tax=Sporocytophaga sp. TaxID=2231183 RepID=UPI001B038313|nr:hypothetical protein [Sporocytophaga sp.]MBO9701673.1 hypothetical protein [Sporocytophaga sp.]
MKRIFTLACLCLLQAICFAQNSGFYYQGVAKMKTGAPISNQNISIYISILSTSPDKLFYKESHSLKTDDAGRFSLVVGEGIVEQGKFNEVDWRSQELWIQTEMNAGTGIEDMGKSRILPVPVANYAVNAENVSNIPYDFRPIINGSQNILKQGETNTKFNAGTESYMYEHGTVEMFFNNTPNGITVSPENFSVNKDGIATKQALTITIDKNLNPGDYEIPVQGKAASGKMRSGKLTVKIIEDSISKYLAGKWKVVDTYGGKDTTYTEVIKVIDSEKFQFTSNIIRNGHILLKDKMASLNYGGNVLGLISFLGPIGTRTLADPTAYFNVAGLINDITNITTFKATLTILYDRPGSSPPVTLSEDHTLTFTRIE